MSKLQWVARSGVFILGSLLMMLQFLQQQRRRRRVWLTTVVLWNLHTESLSLSTLSDLSSARSVSSPHNDASKFKVWNLRWSAIWAFWRPAEFLYRAQAIGQCIVISGNLTIVTQSHRETWVAVPGGLWVGPVLELSTYCYNVNVIFPVAWATLLVNYLTYNLWLPQLITSTFN